ncbi:hypothetical protein F7R02_16730 [Xanthomonas cissicola]|nr:hypothetical protein F7R02_16730 [Xanthomonas cissicola]
MRDRRTRAIACHAHFHNIGQLEEAGRQHARRPHSHGYKDQTDLRVQCKRTERGNALVHCAPLGE